MAFSEGAAVETAAATPVPGKVLSPILGARQVTPSTLLLLQLQALLQPGRSFHLLLLLL